MNIGFYIGRLTYLGHFGPIIDYFRERGDKVIFFCDHRQSAAAYGYKAYQYPYPQRIREIFENDEIKVFHTIEEFAEVIRANQVQVVFFIAFDSIAKEAKAIVSKKANVLFADIQSGGDIMFSKNIAAADVVFIFNDNWRTWWKKWLLNFKVVSNEEEQNIFEQIETKAIACGFAEADQLKKFNREQICKKYGLPLDRRIVILLPFPWRVPFCIWSHIIYKPQSRLLKLLRIAIMRQWSKWQDVFTMADDKKVTKAIRKFADKNNAFFIVKGRLKNKVPRYLAKAADKVIFDDSFYPYTIMELFFVADLCIHFYSDAIKECAVANVPSICLGPTRREDWTCIAERFFLEEFSPKPGSYYNFDGVVYNESVDNFATNFGDESFDNYAMKPVERAKFVKKFLGFDDYNAGKRIYEDLLKRVGSSKV